MRAMLMCPQEFETKTNEAFPSYYNQPGLVIRDSPTYFGTCGAHAVGLIDGLHRSRRHEFMELIPYKIR